MHGNQRRGLGRLRLAAAALVAAVALLARPATTHAGPTNSTGFMMTYGSGLTPLITIDPADYGIEIENGDGTYTYIGAIDSSDFWNFTWNVTVKQDPFVTANTSVTNLSASDQTFFLLMELPIVPPLGAPTALSGSVGGSLTSNTADGATISAVGAPIYEALIDGVVVESLHDPPFSFSTPVGVGATDPLPATGFSQAGPAANSTIGIELEFTLSPFDAADLTSVFEVVPGPAGWAVLSLFALGSGRRRRREEKT
ncbi:MAG: hypothetical protein ACYSTY_03525 [Planctomycetota bacterium]|jgi:hypothetical protein